MLQTNIITIITHNTSDNISDPVICQYLETQAAGGVDIAESLKATAEAVLHHQGVEGRQEESVNSGGYSSDPNYVYDESTGYYYHPATGYYWDPVSKS